MTAGFPPKFLGNTVFQNSNTEWALGDSSFVTSDKNVGSVEKNPSSQVVSGKSISQVVSKVRNVYRVQAACPTFSEK